MAHKYYNQYLKDYLWRQFQLIKNILKNIKLLQAQWKTCFRKRNNIAYNNLMINNSTLIRFQNKRLFMRISEKSCFNKKTKSFMNIIKI